MIDWIIVRAHQHSAGTKGGCVQSLGRSKGGLSTKIHATADALGNPTGFYLTLGQASDLDSADVLHKDIEAQTVKGYDAQQRLVEPLLRAGKAVVIPSIRTRKVQRQYDRHLYKYAPSD